MQFAIQLLLVLTVVFFFVVVLYIYSKINIIIKKTTVIRESLSKFDALSKEGPEKGTTKS